MQNMNLRNNILVNITENKVNRTFVREKQEQLTAQVFDTMARWAEWRPQRDEDGREMILELHTLLHSFPLGALPPSTNIEYWVKKLR